MFRCVLVHMPSVMLAMLVLVLLIMVLLQFCIVTNNSLLPSWNDGLMQVKISYNPLVLNGIREKSEVRYVIKLCVQYEPLIVKDPPRNGHCMLKRTLFEVPVTTIPNCFCTLGTFKERAASL